MAALGGAHIRREMAYMSTTKHYGSRYGMTRLSLTYEADTNYL